MARKRDVVRHRHDRLAGSRGGRQCRVRPRVEKDGSNQSQSCARPHGARGPGPLRPLRSARPEGSHGTHGGRGLRIRPSGIRLSYLARTIHDRRRTLVRAVNVGRASRIPRWPNRRRRGLSGGGDRRRCRRTRREFHSTSQTDSARSRSRSWLHFSRAACPSGSPSPCNRYPRAGAR